MFFMPYNPARLLISELWRESLLHKLAHKAENHFDSCKSFIRVIWLLEK